MAATILRHPAVAGRFYPGDPDDLRAEARGYLSQDNSTNQTSSASLGVHRAACGIHVFRACGGRGICAGGSAASAALCCVRTIPGGSRARHHE